MRVPLDLDSGQVDTVSNQILCYVCMLSQSFIEEGFIDVIPAIHGCATIAIDNRKFELKNALAQLGSEPILEMLYDLHLLFQHGWFQPPDIHFPGTPPSAQVDPEIQIQSPLHGWVLFILKGNPDDIGIIRNLPGCREDGRDADHGHVQVQVGIDHQVQKITASGKYPA